MLTKYRRSTEYTDNIFQRTWKYVREIKSTKRILTLSHIEKYSMNVSLMIYRSLMRICNEI